MAVRLDDLPANVRRQLEQPATKRAAKGGGRTNPGTYRCCTCDNTETVWARAERHADSHGGARIECLDRKDPTA